MENMEINCMFALRLKDFVKSVSFTDCLANAAVQNLPPITCMVKRIVLLS